MFVIMFLFIGAFFMISQNNLALNSSENIDKFASAYVAWFNRIFENAGDLTGYVLKMKWLPEQSRG